jgi:hypothetical protein
LLFIRKNIGKEKGMVKEKSRTEGKGKEAENPMSRFEVQGIWVWMGVFGLFSDGLNFLPS